MQTVPDTTTVAPPHTPTHNTTACPGHTALLLPFPLTTSLLQEWFTSRRTTHVTPRRPRAYRPRTYISATLLPPTNSTLRKDIRLLLFSTLPAAQKIWTSDHTRQGLCRRSTPPAHTPLSQGHTPHRPVGQWCLPPTLQPCLPQRRPDEHTSLARWAAAAQKDSSAQHSKAQRSTARAAQSTGGSGCSYKPTPPHLTACCAHTQDTLGGACARSAHTLRSAWRHPPKCTSRRQAHISC
jgi:hypothetical protein